MSWTDLCLGHEPYCQTLTITAADSLPQTAVVPLTETIASIKTNVTSGFTTGVFDLSAYHLAFQEELTDSVFESLRRERAEQRLMRRQAARRSILPQASSHRRAISLKGLSHD